MEIEQVTEVVERPEETLRVFEIVASPNKVLLPGLSGMNSNV